MLFVQEHFKRRKFLKLFLRTQGKTTELPESTSKFLFYFTILSEEKKKFSLKH